MAIQFNDEAIALTAIAQIKDNLLKAQDATRGAITIGRNIIGGDFLDKTIFDALKEAQRRDPNSDAAITADRVGTSTFSSPKLYYKNPYFMTHTELERYGASMAAMQGGLADALATSVTRYILSMSLAGATAAIGSEATLTHTAAAEIKPEELVQGVFKLGDMAQDIVTIVAPSAAVSKLMSQAVQSTADQISYGGVYEGNIGTLGRSLWMVDAPALIDGAKSKVLGLTEGAITIDETEAVKMITNLNTAGENAGYDFRPEGGYTAQVKGFSWKKASGANPDLATIGAAANWELKSQAKASAGVLILEA